MIIECEGGYTSEVNLPSLHGLGSCDVILLSPLVMFYGVSDPKDCMDVSAAKERHFCQSKWVVLSVHHTVYLSITFFEIHMQTYLSFALSNTVIVARR